MEIKGKEVIGKIKVPKNTKVDIVVGIGESDVMVPIPPLLGLTEEVAKLLMREKSLAFGVNEWDLCATAEDSTNARIIRQFPEYSSTAAINLGGSIDVWRTADSTKWLSIIIVNDSLATDTITK